MEILKFVELLRDKAKEAKDEALAVAIRTNKPPPFLENFPVYVCEYTPNRMSLVGAIETFADKIVIYGNDYKGWYADTRWSADDVMAHADNNDKVMTQEQAESFLEENGKYIVDAMVRAGWDAIEALIDLTELPDKPKWEEEG